MLTYIDSAILIPMVFWFEEKSLKSTEKIHLKIILLIGHERSKKEEDNLLYLPCATLQSKIIWVNFMWLSKITTQRLVEQSKFGIFFLHYHHYSINNINLFSKYSQSSVILFSTGMFQIVKKGKIMKSKSPFGSSSWKKKLKQKQTEKDLFGWLQESWIKSMSLASIYFLVF